jgi:hypothetical protein
MILSATTSMHDRRIKRCVLPIVAFAMVSDHLLSILCLQLERKFTT